MESTTVSVKACSRAHILLSELPGISNTLAYELTIGYDGNADGVQLLDATGSTLKTNPSTGPLLDCNNFKVIPYDRGILLFFTVKPNKSSLNCLQIDWSNLYNLNEIQLV
jgi:hypothetical protein